MGVYIGAVKDDYSAMQGPAPDGFHVPLTTEWQAVRNIRVALGGGSTDGTFGIALKLPFAGYRYRSSASVYGQGSNGNYWSSSRYNENKARYLNFSSTALAAQDNNYRAYGYSVRCFKNSPTVPTSSWTKLYGTSIEIGGIFWSSTDGLISLSSDGQTWITIADKNLGATTVWNSGDTLSETNAGKYYQRGNNYGFPRTGTIANQSTTQVDASNYGPGNYYSSDTFIKYSGRWDSTDNGNLWGGVTGVMPASLKNAYIGEYTLYEGANGKIVHKISQGEIWLVPTSGTTIKIQDKDVGATVAGTTTASYGGWYAFTSIPAAPSGYHVPTSTERQNLMDLWQQITGSNSDDLIMQHLLIPGAGYKDGSTQKDIGAGLYWSSTSYNSSTAYGTRFYPGNTYMDLWKHGKGYGLGVRCFKD